MDPNEARLHNCSNGGIKHLTAADSCVFAAFIVDNLFVFKSECLISFALHNNTRRKQRPIYYYCLVIADSNAAFGWRDYP